MDNRDLYRKLDLEEAVNLLHERDRTNLRLALVNSMLSTLLSSTTADEITETSQIASLLKAADEKYTRVAVLKPYRNTTAADDATEEEKAARLGIIGQTGFEQNDLFHTFPVTRGISGQAYTQQKLIVENAAQSNPQFHRTPQTGENIESILCAPIIREEGVKYVLIIESTKKDAFDEYDISIARAVTCKLEEWYDHIDATDRDVLTLLFNRNRFTRVYNSALPHAKKNQQHLGLIIMDLNDLKQVNDDHGHPAGDRYLAAVARAVRNTIERRDDMAFRLGGDEFAVLLPATPAQGLKKLEGDLLYNIYREVRREEERLMDVEFPEYPVAIGSCDYLDFLSNKGGKTSFYDAVDDLMYKDKQRIKQKKQPHLS